MNLKGKLFIKKINEGNKNEHEVIMLKTNESEIRLNSAFKDKSKKIDLFIGKEVSCEGRITNCFGQSELFLCQDIKEI